MFPTRIDYEKGIEDAGDPYFPNAGVYLLWIRDTFILDTPFTYRDVEEIHTELQDLRPSRYPYLWSSIRNILRDWIGEGLILVLDSYDEDIGSHTLLWSSYYRTHIIRTSKPDPQYLVDKKLEKVFTRLSETNP